MYYTNCVDPVLGIIILVCGIVCFLLGYTLGVLMGYKSLADNVRVLCMDVVKETITEYVSANKDAIKKCETYEEIINREG